MVIFQPHANPGESYLFLLAFFTFAEGEEKAMLEISLYFIKRSYAFYTGGRLGGGETAHCVVSLAHCVVSLLFARCVLCHLCMISLLQTL